ncbi:MAG: prepilin-type N-terminal cleavage/methylation domain-containing protein [Candidatus Riflebacteria bacterium]|nr:prepilin-type N-terminal cleavage/methylation domain-containing protein [Candidatus Riflebacteria bacterium]
MIVDYRLQSARKKGPRIRAYTMPELLITILLLAILFTLSIIFSSGLDQSKRLRDYSVAVALAQQAIEIIRSAPFRLLDNADAGKDSVEDDLNTKTNDDDPFVPDFESGGIKYDRQVKIDDVMAAEDKTRPIGLKLVEITVNWAFPDGGKHDPFVVTTTVADMN